MATRSKVKATRANLIGKCLASLLRGKKVDAKRLDVVRLILGQGARLAIIGVAIGIVASAGLAHLMASILYGIPDEQPAMLYGVSASDPLTMAAASLLLVVVALLACYIPARRAMRVDPTVALRYE